MAQKWVGKIEMAYTQHIKCSYIHHMFLYTPHIYYINFQINNTSPILLQGCVVCIYSTFHFHAVT